MNEVVVTCPDCGEEVTTHVEEGVRGSFVQDCEVCCNPRLVRADTLPRGWDPAVSRAHGSV